MANLHKNSGTKFDRREKLVSNAALNIAVTLIPLAISFFLTPFVIHKLGDSVFGIWAISVSLVGFAVMLDLGLSLTVYKKIAEYLVRDQRDKILATSSVVFYLYCLLGLAIAVIFGIAGQFFANPLFNVPAGLENDAGTAIILMGVGAGICYPLRLFGGIIQGLQGYGFRAIVIVSSAILRTIIVVYLLTCGYGLVLLILTDLAIQVVQGILFYIYTIIKIPYFTARPSKIDRSEIRPIFSFSLQAFILQLSGLVMLSCDQIVIGIFLPVAAVTVYVVGLSIHNVVRSLVVTMQTGILPMASELHAADNETALRELFLRGSKYLLILSLLLAVPAFAFADVFIGWWMGDGYGESALVLQILLIGLAFNTLNLIGTQIFVGMGQLSAYAKNRVLSAFSNLALSIVLLQLMGIVGVALGTAVQFMVSELFLLGHFLSGLGISRARYLRRCILSTVPYALFAGLLLYVYRWCLAGFVDTRPLEAMLLAGALYTIVFLGGVLLLGFGRDERAELFFVLSKFLKSGSSYLRLRKPA